MFTGGSPYCQPPDACGTGGALTVYLSRTTGACPSSNYTLYASIKRPFTTAAAITLPNAAVTMYVSSSDPTKSCNAWTGSVTPAADVPNYSVSINATCSEAGKSAVRLVGTFSGEL